MAGLDLARNQDSGALALRLLPGSHIAGVHVSWQVCVVFRMIVVEGTLGRYWVEQFVRMHDVW